MVDERLIVEQLIDGNVPWTPRRELSTIVEAGLLGRVDMLSRDEWVAFRMKLDGATLAQIGDKIHRCPSMVANIVQRACIRLGWDWRSVMNIANKKRFGRLSGLMPLGEEWQ